MRRIRLIVSGRVQGVGYRYFCKERAAVLGLTGFARNLPDGSVEVEAQGKDAALEEFLQAVSRGPKAGHVANVERSERAVIAESGFHMH